MLLGGKTNWNRNIQCLGKKQYLMLSQAASTASTELQRIKITVH
jgi:hypothetical protein